MAENTTDKEALKAAKEAEKAAKKAKQDRINQSKPKKDGSVFTRAGKAVKKYWKDFLGTIKKIVWPAGKTVIKNSLVVLASIVVIGLVIYGIDQGLTALIGLGSNLAVSAGEQIGAEDETEAGEENGSEQDEAQADEAEETEAETEAQAEETEAEETEAETEAAE